MLFFISRWLRTFTLAISLLTFGFSIIYIADPIEEASAKRKRKKQRKKRRKNRKAATKRSKIKKIQLKKDAQLKPKEDLGGPMNTEAARTIKKKVVPKEISEQKAGKLTTEELRRSKQRAAVGNKLDEEIQDCEELMQFTDEDSPEMASVLQRCADLYWEKSKELFFCSEDLNTPKKKQDQCRKDMKKYQEKTLDNYGRVVSDFKNHPQYDEILYSLGLYKVEMELHTQAVRHFKDIIRYYPESPRVMDAWFQLGEYFFNVENSADKALSAYKYSSQDKSTFIYPFSIYKQGWCHINKGDWELAKQRFRDTIFLTCMAPKEKRDSWSGICRDARRDYVRAYSNIGDVNVAIDDFKKIGGPNNYRKMMENLGLMYVDQGKHKELITAYRNLIKDDPKHIRVVLFQSYIVEAAGSMGNKPATVTQIKTLANYYKQARKKAKESREKAQEDVLKKLEKNLKEATEIAENVVRKIAIEFDKEGSTKKNLRVLSLSRDVYRYYLEMFKDSKHIFEMSWLYAELLYKVAEQTDNNKKYAEILSEAADQYIAVVKMNPDPQKPAHKKIVEAAAGNAVRALSEVVAYQEKIKPIKIKGTAKAKIPTIYNKLISACETYIHYRPEGDDIVEIRYKMARIYYIFNHFEKAAPAFHDIVENHPENDVACYSANLTIDIYTGQEDYVTLQKLSREYLNNKKLACTDKDRANFADIEMKATFKLAEKLEKDEKYLDAAQAYMKFYEKFPDSKFAVLAVNNAAVTYDKGNKIEKAIETKKFLVNKLANHPHADKNLIRDTMYGIAQSYERIVDFGHAADYLEQFASRYPTDKRTKDAVFNAGLYRAVLHQYPQARKNRNLYIKNYKKDVDEGAELAFKMCETLEEEAALLEEKAQKEKKLKELDKQIFKKWEAAHNCYYDYIKNKTYVKTSLDRQCWAQWRRAEIMLRKTKYDKGAKDVYDFLRKSWPKWESKVKKEKAVRCAAAISERKFRDLRFAYKKYSDLRLSQMNPTSKRKIKRFKASLQAKVKERDKLIKRYKEVVEIGVAEWSLAALYMIGELYKDSLDKLLKAPVPRRIGGMKLSLDDIDLLRERLEEMGEPVKASAIEAYQICANKASELGVYNKWSMQALDRLQEYGEYPLVVEMELPPIPKELKLRRLSFIVDDKKQNPEEFKEIKLKVPPPPAPPCVPQPNKPCPPKPKQPQQQQTPATAATAS